MNRDQPASSTATGTHLIPPSTRLIPPSTRLIPLGTQLTPLGTPPIPLGTHQADAHRSPGARLDAAESVVVHGLDVDSESRCAHWHTEHDIVALRFWCCDAYWACRQCHDELASHEAVTWPHTARDLAAARCGACGQAMSADVYLAAAEICPSCGAEFNPGCRLHRHLYFAEG